MVEGVTVALHYTYIEKKTLRNSSMSTTNSFPKPSTAPTLPLASRSATSTCKRLQMVLSPPSDKNIASPLPYREDAPRGPTSPPNFYYDEVDTLVAHATKHGYAWSETALTPSSAR